MKMLLVFACLAAIFATAERLFPARSQPLLRSGFLTDLLYIPIHFLMRVILNGTLAVVLSDQARRLLPPGTVGVLEGAPLWVQVVVLLLVMDLVFYLIHRAKHQWSWWWRLHETHHSSRDLDWLSTVRFHPLEKAIDRLLYLVPLLVLGPCDDAVLAWAAVDAASGMLIHSNLPVRLGPLVYVLNGPELHGWHHAPDEAAQRTNFGNNFSIFDWLFGTARLRPELPPGFGTGDPDYPEGNLWKQFLYAFRPHDREEGGQEATGHDR